MRAFLLLLPCWFLFAPAMAQDPDVAPPSGTIELREFDKERIAALKAGPAFQYDDDLRRVPTLWDRFREWLGRKLRGLFGTRPGTFVADNLNYLIIIAGLIVAVVILRRGGFQRVFHGAPLAMPEVTMEEDIREMDLEAMIREAETAGDLRRAVRLHYLLVLKRLTERGTIAWSPGHTDHDYMAQIADPGMRARFARIALVFQWVWYGNATLGPAQYEPARRIFLEFEQVPATL